MKYIKYVNKCYYDYENSSGDGFLRDDDGLLSFNNKNSIERLIKFRGKIDLTFKFDTFLNAYLYNTLYELITLNYDFYDCHNDQIQAKIDIYNDEPFKIFFKFNPDYLGFVLKRIIKKSFISITFNDNIVNMYVVRGNSIDPEFRISVRNKNISKYNNTNNFYEYMEMIKNGIREIIEA